MKFIVFLLMLILSSPAIGATSAPMPKPQCGIASVYSSHEKGNKYTASGQRMNDHAMAAAHKRLPLGSHVKVTTSKGKTAQVVINDRGPYIFGRIIDLTQAVAKLLGISGLGKVCIQ